MIREMKERFDELPWFIKILLIIFGVNYIFERKGLFWRILQGSIVILLAAILFPLFFLVYFSIYVYYYIQTHEYVLLYLGVTILFLLILIIEIIVFLFKYRRKKGKQKRRKKHNGHSHIWYLFPLLLGGLGGIIVYILVKDKNYGRRLISVGCLQTIVLLIGVMGIAVIADEPPKESFDVAYSYNEDSLTIWIRNTSKGYIVLENVYQNGEIVLACEERIGINQEKEIKIEGNWYEGDIITIETKKGTKVVLVVRSGA